MGSRKPRPGGKPKPPENDEVVVQLEMVGARQVKLTLNGDPDDVMGLLSDDAAVQLRDAIRAKYGDNTLLVSPE